MARTRPLRADEACALALLAAMAVSLAAGLALAFLLGRLPASIGKLRAAARRQAPALRPLAATAAAAACAGALR